MKIDRVQGWGRNSQITVVSSEFPGTCTHNDAGCSSKLMPRTMMKVRTIMVTVITVNIAIITVMEVAVMTETATTTTA